MISWGMPPSYDSRHAISTTDSSQWADLRSRCISCRRDAVTARAPSRLCL